MKDSQLVRQNLIDFDRLTGDRADNYEEDLFIREFIQTLRKRWKPAAIAFGSVFSVLFLTTMLQTPLYESETLILLDKKQQNTSILPDEGVAALYDSDDLSTEIEILRSYSLVRSAIESQPEVFKGLTIEDVRENLAIRQAGDADVLIISYVNETPEKARAILEALGSTYVNYSLNRQRSLAANGVNFIDEQLPQAQTELKKVTQAVRDFRQKHGMVSPDAYATKLSEQKQELEQLAKDAQTTLNAKEQEYKQLQSQLGKVQQDPDQALAYAVLSEDATYQNLANQLSNIEAEYALKSTKFNDNHPVIIDLIERKQAIEKLVEARAKENLGEDTANIDIKKASPVLEREGIKQNLTSQLIEAETAIVSWQAQREGIERARAEVLENFRKLPQLQQTFSELQRQLKVKSQTVDFLLQKQQELEISEAQEIAPWEIIEPPLLPEDPISPNRIRNSILALVAGCISGVATAMLMQRVDPKVKQVEEIRRITDLPMLGAIPQIPEPEVKLIGVDRDELSPSYNYSAFTESLRSVAMNLRYLEGDSGKIKSLSVTSANAAEGKSTFIYNLGLVLADLGLRVLVVDADLRKPKLHKLANVSNTTGLSTAIATESGWLDFVLPGKTENVHILTSGPKFPNPVAMLDSPRMKEMIAEWEQFYDYVLIDTPPASLMADAQIVASQVDSLIFVSGINKGNRDGIRRALEQLRGTNANIIGFVANFIDKGHKYYSYSYSDYYQSYGDSDSDPGDSNSRSRLLKSWRRN